MFLCGQAKEYLPPDKDRSLISRAEGARALPHSGSWRFGPADSGRRVLMWLFKQWPVITRLYWWLWWGNRGEASLSAELAFQSGRPTLKLLQCKTVL